MAQSGIGNKIAPPRFLLFLGVLAAGFVAALVYHERISLGFLAAFDVAVLVFLATLLPTVRTQDPELIRAQATANDANRTMLLVITGVVTSVVLIAVASESVAKNLDWQTKALIIATLVLAWLFSNIVYAFHYAHLAYRDRDPRGCQSLNFHETEWPVYWDFIYFSFTLGMTFQTSDVDIRDRKIRRVVTAHCLVAFFYDIGVLAFTINVLGSAGG